MKKALLFMLLLSSSVILHAQNNSYAASLDELRPPSSPGFSILGVQPTEISRPSSWKALQTNLSNSFFQDDKLIIPKNFAMEFNPFFIPNDSGASVYNTFMNKDQACINSIKNHFNISMATGTFNSYLDTSLKNQRMGLGLRTQVIEMKPTDRAIKKFGDFIGNQTGITTMNTILMSVKDSIDAQFKVASSKNKPLVFDLEKVILNILATNKDSVLNFFWQQTVYPQLQQLKSTKTLSATDTSQNIAVKQANYDIINQLISNLNNLDEMDNFKSSYDAAKDAVNDKYGTSLEFAAAFLIDFPTNDIAFSKVPKFGIWTTYTYRFKNQIWEVGGLVRYINAKFDKEARQNNFDFGARAMIGGSKWSLNGELIQRYQWQVLSTTSGTNGSSQAFISYSSDFKMSLTANYVLTDDIIINYTFGNGFTVNTEFDGPAGNLISSVGVVYALGGPKMHTKAN